MTSTTCNPKKKTLQKYTASVTRYPPKRKQSPPHAPSTSTYDARLLTAKVVDSIWNTTIIRVDADELKIVESKDDLMPDLHRKSEDVEVIQIDLLVDHETLKVLKFDQLGKIYLEMDAVIEDMQILRGGQRQHKEGWIVNA